MIYSLCKRNQNFAFVAVRIIGNTGVNATPFTSTNISRLLAENLPVSKEFIEWSELDKFLCQLDHRALAYIAANGIGRFGVVFE